MGFYEQNKTIILGDCEGNNTNAINQVASSCKWGTTAKVPHAIIAPYLFIFQKGKVKRKKPIFIGKTFQQMNERIRKKGVLILKRRR
jgi:hypothetical protein